MALSARRPGSRSTVFSTSPDRSKIETFPSAGADREVPAAPGPVDPRDTVRRLRTSPCPIATSRTLMRPGSYNSAPAYWIAIDDPSGLNRSCPLTSRRGARSLLLPPAHPARVGGPARSHRPSCSLAITSAQPVRTSTPPSRLGSPTPHLHSRPMSQIVSALDPPMVATLAPSRGRRPRPRVSRSGQPPDLSSLVVRDPPDSRDPVVAHGHQARRIRTPIEREGGGTGQQGRSFQVFASQMGPRVPAADRHVSTIRAPRTRTKSCSWGPSRRTTSPVWRSITDRPSFDEGDLRPVRAQGASIPHGDREPLDAVGGQVHDSDGASAGAESSSHIPATSEPSALKEGPNDCPLPETRARSSPVDGSHTLSFPSEPVVASIEPSGLNAISR